MLNDIRCNHCSKLLAKGDFVTLEIKCPRCKKLNILSATSAFEAERHERQTDPKERSYERSGKQTGTRPQRL